MKYKNFSEFYPFYLSEHQNLMCRRLHFVGSFLAIIFAVLAVLFSSLLILLLAVLSGYAFAWVGHYFFEHNRPATFLHPIYSFLGDWVMFWQILRGKISLLK